MYETKKGDNLSTIAKSNNTTVQGLLKANPNISNPNFIKIGQKINIGSQTPIAQQVASNIQSNVPNTVNAQAIDNVSPIKVPVVPQNTPTTLKTAKDTVSTLPQKEIVQQSNDNVVRSLYQRGVTDPNQIIDVINYDQNGNKVSNLTLDDVFRVTDTIKADTAKSKSDELLRAIGSNSQNNELNLIDLRSEYNIDTKKQELSDIQKKIADRTAQYEKAFIDTEGQVIPIEDIQGQKALVKRQMESEMAAYSAKAQVIQNDLASAESTVRDFMQARSADVKDYSDRLKMLYADAKDTLNESQKRIVERATKEADRKYVSDQKNLDFITEQALLAQKNGAPADLVAKVMQAKTRDEASKLVGKFSRDPLEVASKQLEMKLKQAQISKVYQDISESREKSILDRQKALASITGTPSSDKATQAIDILSSINKLSTNKNGLKYAVGVNFNPFAYLPGTNTADFKVQLNQFKNMLALPNLEKLKGSMSDKDVEFIKNISTSLDRSMSEKAFKDELLRVQDIFTNVAIKNGVAPETLPKTEEDIIRAEKLSKAFQQKPIERVDSNGNMIFNP